MPPPQLPSPKNVKSLLQGRFSHLSNHFQHSKSSQWMQKIQTCLVESSANYSNGVGYNHVSKDSLSSRRYYHDASHILALMSLYDTYESIIHYKESFQLVVLFHDLVYNVHRTDNEHASSREFLLWSVDAKNITDEEIQWVKLVIDATASHLKYAKLWSSRVGELRENLSKLQQKLESIQGSAEGLSNSECIALKQKIQQDTSTLHQYEDGLRFLDMDLSVLQWPREDYARYAQQIRNEYAPLFSQDTPKDSAHESPTYAKKRLEFLESFLKESRFYYSDICDMEWEQRARENLEWEQKQLLSETMGKL